MPASKKRPMSSEAAVIDSDSDEEVKSTSSGAINLEDDASVDTENEEAPKKKTVRKKIKSDESNRLLTVGMSEKKKANPEVLKKAIQNLGSLHTKPAAKKKKTDESTQTCHTITEIPIDYTLKTFISFKSPVNFLWANNLSANSRVSGLSSFVTGHSPSQLPNQKVFPSQSASQSTCISQNNNQPTVDQSSDLYKALLYYIYPSSPLPHCLLTKIKDLTGHRKDNSTVVDVYENYEGQLGQIDTQYMNERYLCWFDALTTLFTSFVEGLCPYFYLLYDYTHKSSMVFISNSTFGGKAKRCIISNPSTDLINSLKEEQIEFKEIHSDRSDSRTEADNIMLSARTEAISSQFKSLVIIGRQNLHALVDFLINYHLKFLHCDIPQIISPNSFLNSTLKKTKLFPRSTDDKENKYVLEVRGYLLPHSFLDLCSIVQQVHSNFICSVKETKEETLRLNDFQALEVATPLLSQSGASFTNHVVQQNFSYSEFDSMKGQTIRSISHSSNVFSVRLKKC